MFKITHFTWKASFFFALSGIIHFALGRTFGYKTIQLIGANRSGIITGMNVIVSVILAFIVLKEAITIITIIGMLLSLSGPVIMALKEEKLTSSSELKLDSQNTAVERRNFYMGVFYGAASAVFWGSSAIFIKLGLNNGGSSLAGTFIAYCAATLIVSASLLNKENRNEIFKVDKQSLKVAFISGMCTNVAQMLKFIALSYGTVIVVSMMSRTVPIWVLIFSFVFNRKYESFSTWVLVGNILLIMGTLLVLFY